MGSIDFVGLNREILARAHDWVPSLLPGGRLIGKEYTCADLNGGKGDSCKVNLATGKWADFSTDTKGGDLIMLYAAVAGLKQVEAAKKIAAEIGYRLPEGSRIPSSTPNTPPPEPIYILPPKDAPKPSLKHFKHGKHSAAWVYRSAEGDPLFYVARYDPKGEKKQICPWSWDAKIKNWVAKHCPAPRVLFKLPDLSSRTSGPTRPVLIVEGEKAAVAAAEIAGKYYAVTTWSGGGKAWKKTDWSPVHGRPVLIWPDADDLNKKTGRFEGVATAEAIASALAPHCPEVKILDVAAATGWDAADALEEGWDWDRFLKWAKERVKLFGVREESPDTPAPEIVGRVPDDPSVAAAGDSSDPQKIILVPDQPEPTMTMLARWEDIGLTMTTAGYPHCNVDNVVRVLDSMDNFTNMVWYDEFYHKYLTKDSEGVTREWTDIDDLTLSWNMQRQVKLYRVSDEMVHKAVAVYCHRKDRVRNAPRDWMNTLVWDQKERIDGFFYAWMGVDLTAYSQAVSRNFWLGMVARIFKPGCQVDNMVLIEGKQGVGKTQAMKAIAGQWYVDAKEHVNSKDFYMTLRGKMLVEISELEAFRRADMTAIKQAVSAQVDTYRAPYERRAKDHPRMCVFVGTTNQDQYLGDVTGARRFWPLACTKVDLDGIRKNRDQLFAEAVSRFKAGASWYETPGEETIQQQEKRRIADEWEHNISVWVHEQEQANTMLMAEPLKVVLSDVWREALKGEVSQFDKLKQMRVAQAMRALGFRRKDGRIDGVKAKYWVRLDPLKTDGNGR